MDLSVERGTMPYVAQMRTAALGRRARPLRERIACRWVRSHLGSTAHERRVAKTCSILFDILRPLHHLPADERRLLRLAALVHDVGRSVDNDDHPALGADMILEELPLPMRRSRLRRLAYLTRYHRGAVPELDRDELLRPGDQRSATRLLLAILRVADTLDCRQLPSPRLNFALAHQEGRRPRLKIIVHIECDADEVRGVFDRRKKTRLLAELLDLRIDVQIAEQ
jgi:exopolyphosphatase/pppGpp-phosphohydrolase